MSRHKKSKKKREAEGLIRNRDGLRTIISKCNNYRMSHLSFLILNKLNIKYINQNP